MTNIQCSTVILSNKFIVKLSAIYRLTQVVLEKRPLNGCNSRSSYQQYRLHQILFMQKPVPLIPRTITEQVFGFLISWLLNISCPAICFFFTLLSLSCETFGTFWTIDGQWPGYYGHSLCILPVLYLCACVVCTRLRCCLMCSLTRLSLNGCCQCSSTFTGLIPPRMSLQCSISSSASARLQP